MPLILSWSDPWHPNTVHFAELPCTDISNPLSRSSEKAGQALKMHNKPVERHIKPFERHIKPFQRHIKPLSECIKSPLEGISSPQRRHNKPHKRTIKPLWEGKRALGRGAGLALAFEQPLVRLACCKGRRSSSNIWQKVGLVILLHACQVYSMNS